jgi:hypothetical protein
MNIMPPSIVRLDARHRVVQVKSRDLKAEVRETRLGVIFHEGICLLECRISEDPLGKRFSTFARHWNQSPNIQSTRVSRLESVQRYT